MGERAAEIFGDKDVAPGSTKKIEFAGDPRFVVIFRNGWNGGS
jgi:hypothetical protein